MNLHPQEISHWIRSKKKDVMPSLKPATYGNSFKSWWLTIQPSWRTEGDVLARVVLQAETWQVLRKGSTSGIYVVIIELSWWVKAQQDKCDTNAWVLVDDLLWVI